MKNSGSKSERVRGPFGMGEVNDAGQELLSFLTLNEATICNTWFEKKMIHRQTWQHTKSKRWHCIDYAVVRQKDRKLVLDAEVKHGAECQTDHQLLQVKVRMLRDWFWRWKKNKMSMRFNVSKLFEQKNESDAAPTCTMFQEAVSSKAKELWMADSPIDDQWNALSSVLTEAAKTILGTEK